MSVNSRRIAMTEHDKQNTYSLDDINPSDSFCIRFSHKIPTGDMAFLSLKIL